MLINLQYKNLLEENYTSLKEVPFSDIAFFQEGPGIRNWQYVTSGGINFINIRCIKNNDINLDNANQISKEEAFGKYSHFLLREDDIVVSCSGTLGRSAIVRKNHLPLCLNTSIIRFSPLLLQDCSFLYGYLHSKEFLDYQAQFATGSAQVNFGPMHLKQLMIKTPPKEVRKEFEQKVRPLIRLKINNYNEIDNLSKSRDILLPKLLSGEIDISRF